MASQNDLKRAQRLARELSGGRYIWGGCSRKGSDCSGFMSILLNSITGRTNVFVRRFATGGLRQAASRLGLKPGLGDANDFNLGVRYPHESRNGIGHVAGTLGGLPVESRGSYGVLVGRRARSATSPLFKHHFHLPVTGGAGRPVTRRRSLLHQPYPGHGHRRGMKDRHVRLIQERLNQLAGPGGHGELGGGHLTVDGDFGARTERIVRVFQRNRGLDQSGAVGPITWARMFRK
jgi:hypothetical protein